MPKKNKADDVDMDDDDDDDDDIQAEVQFLPTLQVIVGPQEKTRKEENVSSQEIEETSQQAGHSEETEIPELDLSRISRPEDRYGYYIIRHLKPEHQELLRNMAFNSQNVLSVGDMEGRSPLRYEEIGHSSMLMMLEYLVHESHKNFMEIFAPSTRTDITDEQCYEFRLELKKVFEANKNATQDNFENVEEPDLMDDDPNIPLQRREDQGRADPEFKGTAGSLSRENNHTILETEDDLI